MDEFLRFDDLKTKYIINIQLFAEGEKTEEATPRKKDESRKKGQIPKSKDLPQVTTLLVGMIIINIMIKVSYRQLAVSWQKSFSGIFVSEFNIELVKELMITNFFIYFSIIAPILMAILVAGLFANYIQVGFLFTLEPLKPTFDKINILKGIKSMFSLKKLVELFKTVIKLIIIGYYAYRVIKNSYNEILILPAIGFAGSFIFIFKIAYDLVVKISMALFAIAVFDYFYQKWEYNKSLKMSKQEIKEEYKQTEGDPQIKGRMRQMQRELLKKKMIQDVPESTVIITNPTHLSIAIKYEKGMDAPKILAKGADNIAFKIREIAKEHNIPMVENKPLARALYKSVEPGEFVPEEFYKAIAEVLKYVMMGS